MKRFISSLMMACMLFVPVMPCTALGEDEYADEYEEEGEVESIETSMSFEPKPVLLFGRGISIAVPADFTESAISGDMASQGVLACLASPDDSFDLQIDLQMPAIADEYFDRLDESGVEKRGWLYINDVPFLLYMLPDQERLFAVVFDEEQGYALNFAFLASDAACLGDLPYEIL